MQVCPAVAGGTAVCNAGACSGNCTGASSILCNGTCVSKSSDVNNCGTCGNVCPAAPSNAVSTCSSGACSTACLTGFTQCPSGCKSLASDPSNCGTCGNACTPQDGNSIASCSSGRCVQSCKPGYTQCGASCVNTTSDPSNCGACGTGCSTSDPNAMASCNSGSCAITCPPSYPTQCGTPTSSSCTNTQVDPASCGTCGNTCTVKTTSGFSCNNGTCPALQYPDITCPANQRTPVASPNGQGGHTFYTCPGFDGVFCSPPAAESDTYGSDDVCRISETGDVKYCYAPYASTDNSYGVVTRNYCFPPPCVSCTTSIDCQSVGSIYGAQVCTGALGANGLGACAAVQSMSDFRQCISY